MAQEPNLFGELQEREPLPPPQKTRFRFIADIYPWDDIKGIAEIDMAIDPDDPPDGFHRCKVLKWTAPPPWDEPEWADMSRDYMTIDFLEDEIEVLEP